MNTYSKNGLRQVKLAERKKTKEHIKSFYKIINQINDISESLDKTIDYNEENINDYVRPMLGRDLDSTEKMLLLSKLSNYKEVIENNIEVKHGPQ